MKNLKAFHGDPAVKARYLNRLRAYTEAGRLDRKDAWDQENGRGGPIGCTIEAGEYEYDRYADEVGLPTSLAHLKSHIFRYMRHSTAMRWPVQALEAIPVGADAQAAVDNFLCWLLVAPDSPIARWNQTAEVVQVGKLYKRKLAGSEPDVEEWRVAEEAVWNAEVVGAGKAKAATTKAEEYAAYAAMQACFAAKVAAGAVTETHSLVLVERAAASAATCVGNAVDRHAQAMLDEGADDHACVSAGLQAERDAYEDMAQALVRCLQEAPAAKAQTSKHFDQEKSVMTNIKWDAVSKETIGYVREILRRAEELELGPAKNDRPGLCMDLEAASVVLDTSYERLLEAAAGDFCHDVLGIYEHFNRDTGEMDNGFAPRFLQASGEPAP